jgi:hypothetical protein
MQRYDLRISFLADSPGKALDIADSVDLFMEDNFHDNLDSTAVAPEAEFDREFHDRAEAFTDSVPVVVTAEGYANPA